MTLALPAFVAEILTRLTEAGHEAYLVGGCVRDGLLGLTPHDWDVTTSAAPAQTMAALAGIRLIPTGLQHGTITAVSAQHLPVEVTTYRIDGAYSDGRRPDSVRFTRSLREDLARRDFTINAMAWHPKTGLIDLFGGENDVTHGIIRCVGIPTKRFTEDALRILRALRFATRLGFAIEEETARAMLAKRALLERIAPERISAELLALLAGAHVAEVLLAFAPIVTEVLPELAPCIDYEQHSPYHMYTVYEHCVRATAAAPPDPVLRLAMLLHDCAKPACRTEGIDGRFHFYGHLAKGAELVRAATLRLRLDNAAAQRICFLVERHDIEMEPERRAVIRLLSRFGEAAVRDLLLVHRADNAAQSRFANRSETYDEFEALLALVLAEQACFSLHDLAVNGADIMDAGVPRGPAVGNALQTLLALVVDGKCQNERTALLTVLSEM